MTSDDALLSGFLVSHDEAAFERLVLRHGPMVLRVCRDILNDFSAAEDAFQATFLVLFRQAGSIREREAVGRWLYEVACRVARRARQGDSKRRAQERRAVTMEAATPPDHEVADQEWRPILHEEILILPPRLREAVILCYLEGWTVEAAARQLGCPSGTLKSRLSKARELLRARLIRRGLAVAVVLLLIGSIEKPCAASELSASLVRSTVSAALGDPLDVAGRVAALAGAEEPARRLIGLKRWALLFLLFAVFGARWSLAWTTEAAPRVITNFASLSPARPAWWASFFGDRPAAVRHCQTTH